MICELTWCKHGSGDGPTVKQPGWYTSPATNDFARQLHACILWKKAGAGSMLMLLDMRVFLGHESSSGWVHLIVVGVVAAEGRRKQVQSLGVLPAE